MSDNPPAAGPMVHDVLALDKKYGTPQTSPLAAPPARSIDLDGTTAASWYEALRMADAEIAPHAAEIARLKEIRDRAAGHLQEAMGDAELARIGGALVLSWKWSKPGRMLDEARLRARFGDAAIDECMKDKKAARPFKVTGE